MDWIASYIYFYNIKSFTLMAFNCLPWQPPHPSLLLLSPLAQKINHPEGNKCQAVIIDAFMEIDYLFERYRPVIYGNLFVSAPAPWQGKDFDWIFLLIQIFPSPFQKKCTQYSGTSLLPCLILANVYTENEPVYNLHLKLTRQCVFLRLRVHLYFGHRKPSYRLCY